MGARAEPAAASPRGTRTSLIGKPTPPPPLVQGRCVAARDLTSPDLADALRRHLDAARQVLHATRPTARYIREVVDGPSGPLFDLVRQMRGRARDLLAAGSVAAATERLLDLGLSRLESEVSHLARALYDGATDGEQLTGRRDAVAATLLFLETVGDRDGNEPIRQVLGVLSDERFRQLGDGELAAALVVLHEAGQLGPAGYAYLSAHKSLQDCAAQDIGGRRRHEARIRQMLEVVVKDPQMDQIRRHLRHTHASKVRATESFWHKTIATADVRAIRRRLDSLADDVSQQLRVVLQLEEAFGLHPERMAGDGPWLGEDLDQQLADIKVALDLARQLLDGAALVPSVARARLSVRRESPRENRTRGATNGHEVLVVDESSGRVVGAEEGLRRQADALLPLARGVEAYLGIVGEMLGEIAYASALSPERIQREMGAAVDRLAAAEPDLGRDERRLIARARDLVHISENLGAEERATALLADLVLLREQNKLLYRWVHAEYHMLDGLLTGAIERLVARDGGRKKGQPSAAGNLISRGIAAQRPADEGPGGDGEGTSVRETPQRAAASCGPPVSAAAQARSERADEEESDAWSSACGRRRRLSTEALEQVREAFYPGTFSSPLRSLVYHQRKHAQSSSVAGPGVSDEVSLMAYLADARRQVARWAEAEAAGNGYLTLNRVDPKLPIRVIDDDDAYLAMTDEPEPRIVSFRDRRRFGRG